MFKKGNVANPSGRPKMPKELREVVMMTTVEYKTIVTKVMNMTAAEMQEKMNDPKTRVIELSVLSVFVNAIKHGDYKRLDNLVSRVIGTMNMDININGQIVHTAESVRYVVSLPSNGFDQLREVGNEPLQLSKEPDKP